ncbi:LysR family transcriptional regulator [Thalassobius sp. I31.1]|uniref:LysR family transcriptional regulator n=1 Tax=Thalassobius sp. I31.1 TaxID=2109912 RepID=UPI000D1B29D5|nr:LysR family transcriptional regulator [Thalassobius sp. I31.1]
MTLDQLTTFLWVARLGGVRRTALEMNLSQPAVSGRISALEDSLGTQLFDRAQRGVSLTKQGLILREHAEKMAGLVEDIKATVVSDQSVNELLRIGVVETIVQLWLPTFLSDLYEKYPNLKVEITVDLTVNLRQQLLERSLDVAILMGPVSEYSVDNIDLSAVDLSWLKATAAPEPDLSVTPVVSYNRNSRPYRELRAELTARHGMNTQIFTTSSIYAGLEMVASGICVGMFPRKLAASLIEQGRVVEFDPGWRLNPLRFTVSYLGEPKNNLNSQAAKVAHSAAETFWKEQR